MATVRDRFLPMSIPANRLAACFGLIGDTHIPERLVALPDSLFEALQGVDAILHTGDLSELRVLEELRRIAPAVAVQGNDESDEGRHVLPLHRQITIAGTRVLLIHGHYLNRAEEIASRQDERWESKLAYRATLGADHGASVVIFGHIHIPLVRQFSGRLLVNPGALAAASGATRQRRQTIALLYVRDDGAVRVVHLDLEDLTRPYDPKIDWDKDFRAAHEHYHESILSTELAADFAYLRTQR